MPYKEETPAPSRCLKGTSNLYYKSILNQLLFTFTQVDFLDQFFYFYLSKISSK